MKLPIKDILNKGQSLYKGHNQRSQSSEKGNIVGPNVSFIRMFQCCYRYTCDIIFMIIDYKLLFGVSLEVLLPVAVIISILITIITTLLVTRYYIKRKYVRGKYGNLGGNVDPPPQGGPNGSAPI